MSEIFGNVGAKMRGAIVDTTDVLLVIAGSGGAGALGEVVKSWLPEQTETLADEILVAGVGFALLYYGDRVHPKLVPFGLGVFLTGVGAWAAEFVAPILLNLKRGPAA